MKAGGRSQFLPLRTALQTVSPMQLIVLILLVAIVAVIASTVTRSRGLDSDEGSGWSWFGLTNLWSSDPPLDDSPAIAGQPDVLPTPEQLPDSAATPVLLENPDPPAAPDAAPDPSPDPCSDSSAGSGGSDS